MNSGIARMKPQHDEAAEECTNVGENERWLSMFGAGVLVTCGLMRGSLSFMALGAGLAYRGYTGKCHVYEALGYNTAEPKLEDSARLIVGQQ